jgi:hypothetical protein
MTVSDPRPDELLERCGRLYWRLNLAIAWTDGLANDLQAKTCSRGGPAAWKAAKPLREQVGEESAAAGFFKERARKRNPLVAAAASRLDLVEYDSSRTELDRKHGIPRLPKTLGWQSRRGPHMVFRTPPGQTPAKIQVDADGITVISDGYLVCAPAWRAEHGVVYELNETYEPVQLPDDLRELLLRQGARKRAETRRRFAKGDEIPKGDRNIGIFWFAVDRLREGLAPSEALERTLKAAREQCKPPLESKRAREQFRGAVKFVTEHPTETERARTEARRVLREHRTGARTDEGSGPTRTTTGKRKRALERRSLRQITAEPVEWAIDKKIPLGTLSLIAGVGGLGKSALMLAWTKEITDAGGDVLIVSYEDAAAQVIRPRFEALGGDLDRLHELYVDVLDGSVSFPTDLPELDRHIRETQARAVLIDPVSASIDLKLDAHRDQDVRVVLGQLAQLAERQRLAIPMNAHLNKAPSADPYLRINGSTAFYNAARSVLTVTRDPAEPDWQRLIAHHKSNYGQLAEVERWRIKPTMVVCDGVPIETMVMEFVEIAEDVSREDVLANRPGVEKLDEAIAFLKDALADGEWHDSAGLVILAAAQRISERTLRRAALDELQVEHERRGFPSTTWWRPSSHANPSPHDLA